MDYLKEHANLVAQYKTLQHKLSQIREDMDQVHQRAWELRQIASMAGIVIESDPCFPLRYTTKTIEDCVLAVLTEAPGYPGVQRKHIAKETENLRNKKINLNSLNGVLHQLKKEGRIESPAFGFYQVAGKVKPVT